MVIRVAEIFVALALVLGPLSGNVCAHGDFHTLITEANKLIDSMPNDPEGWLKRGELYRLHQQWEAAAADYEKAASLGAKQTALDLSWGRFWLDTNWPLSTRTAMDRLLAASPNHVEGHLLRGRALTRLGQHLDAAADFTKAIGATQEPGPDLFIERAQILAAGGPQESAAALATLDEGIKKLGPLVTLQLTAIDLELKRKNFDAALARLDGVAAKSPRKETWLVRRGEVLLQANRPDEARKAYRDALASMQTLPPARRNVPAMVDLEKRIQKELQFLDGPGPVKP